MATANQHFDKLIAAGNPVGEVFDQSPGPPTMCRPCSGYVRGWQQRLCPPSSN
jgi:hypothetical protein